MRLAESSLLDASTVGRIAIVVTELATNLVRYGANGSLLFRCTPDEGFEVISIDRGPGMDLQRCLQDGYSTGGSAGTGLGAIRRLATEFDIYSLKGQGTVVWARCREASVAGAANPSLLYAGISLPAPGEDECGDAWDVQIGSKDARIVVADGLGHGTEAAKASARVIHEFRRNDTFRNAKSFLEHTHGALAGTRGAAVATGQLPIDHDQFTFAGIGNISATMLSSESSKGLMSHNGTLGSSIRSIQAVQYQWPLDGWLVMHSDGLISRWSETAYPGVLARHPAIFAALLIRDFVRGRDDVTVVIMRRRQTSNWSQAS